MPVMLSDGSATFKAICMVGALLAYIFTQVFNTISNIPSISPFNETIADLSHKYPTPITPADATFSIWGVIYLWQLALVIYCMTLMCRKCNGKPLYVYPGVVPTSFFVFYIINLLGNNGWIVAWLSEKLVAAASILAFGEVTLIICLVASCQELDRSGGILEANGFSADIWCTRIIVNNGRYWFLTGYVFTHYLTFLVALYGIHVANYDPAISYENYALALMFLTFILTIAKLVILIVRSVKDPIHYPTHCKKVMFQPLVNELLPGKL
ncbi:uncharacterized protein [Watersipora subatra]|uniref:uncharacterized protein n=1 Tax=Watersipora subatra TaxID=2589382 RepID=UPI00355C7416